MGVPPRGVGLFVASLRSVLCTSLAGCHYYPSRIVPNKGFVRNLAQLPKKNEPDMDGIASLSGTL
jgi:hypothetical protein